jgi:hypothetical protein
MQLSEQTRRFQLLIHDRDTKFSRALQPPEQQKRHLTPVLAEGPVRLMGNAVFVEEVVCVAAATILIRPFSAAAAATVARRYWFRWSVRPVDIVAAQAVASVAVDNGAAGSAGFQ